MTTAHTVQDSAPPHPGNEAPLIRPHTLDSLLRAAVSLYTRNFKTIFLCYLLPSLPILMLQAYAEAAHSSETFKLLLFLPSMIVSFIATGAITFALSDICLGNTPDLRASYARLFRGTLWLKLLGTSLLATLAMIIGVIALIIPGLIVIVLLAFTSQVVVLERMSGVSALKRSAALVKGSFWRTAGTFALLFVILYGVLIVSALLLGMVMGLLSSMGVSGTEEELAAILVAFIAGICIGTVYPFLFCVIILMYYDRRARIESYGVAHLEEDLMR
ncbi:MAG TPA: hypothetical protein VMS40_06610 [Vicinamibacterales bacterium]|nr:hypothetical protein [Vicinamibacterales bacterium]